MRLNVGLFLRGGLFCLVRAYIILKSILPRRDHFEPPGPRLDGDLVAEDYLDEVRGHSCLLVDIPDDRLVHVVCSPRAEYLAIITAYLPEPSQWSPDVRRRIG